ncbi:hypothetical protein L9F63_012632 [Diploptera punctata]|uniref:C2H2-type domain-containing protein n=1 Tax=Diploptera punctata TaxID=6984 RepID=A0AAD8ADG9_DIPPU|nr:hypothetical protein L9F63_012632 [Diploptera punctata]
MEDLDQSLESNIADEEDENREAIEINAKPLICSIKDIDDHREEISFQENIKISKTVEKPFTCNMCYICFSDESEYSTHLYKQHGEKSSRNGPQLVYIRMSTQDEVSLTTIKSYISHVDNCKESPHHTTDKDFSCNSCNKSFLRKSHLKEHIQIIHSKVKLFTCLICKKSFGRKSGLNRHERTHSK